MQHTGMAVRFLDQRKGIMKIHGESAVPCLLWEFHQEYRCSHLKEAINGKKKRAQKQS
ncbi:uncharacterized protein LOC114876441 isoform X2 [Osmia bicornis bicornis]|uniref:uncharacterized protein LOC114876441 isoform X2 n=1 Tax=Osmia bicornis bicornis TaxID=1437191 RepID=UPI001EAF4CB7|nr:uncharacterized protein LOC114876441 isoform X2 [Osmia bicornis bicornis]